MDSRKSEIEKIDLFMAGLFLCKFACKFYSKILGEHADAWNNAAGIV